MEITKVVLYHDDEIVTVGEMPKKEPKVKKEKWHDMKLYTPPEGYKGYVIDAWGHPWIATYKDNKWRDESLVEGEIFHVICWRDLPKPPPTDMLVKTEIISLSAGTSISNQPTPPPRERTSL